MTTIKFKITTEAQNNRGEKGPLICKAPAVTQKDGNKLLETENDPRDRGQPRRDAKHLQGDENDSNNKTTQNIYRDKGSKEVRDKPQTEEMKNGQKQHTKKKTHRDAKQLLQDEMATETGNKHKRQKITTERHNKDNTHKMTTEVEDNLKQTQ